MSDATPKSWKTYWTDAFDKIRGRKETGTVKPVETTPITTKQDFHKHYWTKDLAVTQHKYDGPFVEKAEITKEWPMPAFERYWSERTDLNEYVFHFNNIISC
jgi:hypothetical protein